MLAYHLGVEVECKIAEAIDPRHYQTGFHATATCGTFAAAAAGAKLMGLDVEATARALSHRRQPVGRPAREFRHDDQAVPCRPRRRRAASSRRSSPRIGWTATDKILEAPRGFFRAAGGGYDAGAIVGKLGAPWTFAEPGISIKPHPSGSLTHPGMTEMLRLIREHDITRRGRRARPRRHQPQHAERADPSPADATSCRPSSPWSSAWRSCCSSGSAGLAEFTDEVVTAPGRAGDDREGRFRRRRRGRGAPATTR